MTATATVPPPPTTRRQFRLGVRTMPGWLRVVSALVAVLALAAGVVALLTALSRHNAADSALRQAAPLVVNAQVVDTELSDADTTVAGGVLAGSVLPATAQTRYQDDLAAAASALSSVTGQAGGDGALSGAARTLSIDIPIYQGIVQTALANNRQGFPVGAAYLGEADNLMRATILPAATSLNASARAQLDHDNNTATATLPLVITLVLLAASLIGLVILQWRVTRRFRRLLNFPMVLATALVVAVGVWAIAATGAEHRAVTRGQQQGVAPLTTLAQARTLAFGARGDDELTLVTRDAVASYQQDYTTTVAKLQALLSSTPTGGWTAAQGRVLAQATAALTTYTAQHNKVRAADNGGNLTQAISLDTTAARAAAQLDSVLAGGIDAAVASFNTSASGAASDVNGVGWWWLALMVIAALAVLAGVEPRIREYR